MLAGRARRVCPERSCRECPRHIASSLLLIRCGRFLHRCLAALAWTEVLGQVIEHRVAIRIGDDRPKAFHFFQLLGPLLARQVLLGNAAGVMARSASRLHLGLHRSGGKRFARRAGSLCANKNGGDKQKKYRKESLKQAGPHKHSRPLKPIRVAPRALKIW